MIWLILGILVAGLLFGALGFKEEEYETKWGNKDYKTTWKIQKRQLLAALGLTICLVGCFTKIPANNVGIVYSPFGGTRSETLTEGFKRKNPLDKIYKISTETQTTRVENLTTQTNDAQYVTSTLDVKYKVNASNAFLVFKQYRTLDKMSADLIMPTSQRVLELITTNYNVIDILGAKRADVYTELNVKLSEELALYGVDFVSITILDMDAGEKLEAAITEEAVAKKAVETAEQNLLKAETEAKQKSVQAKAEQEAAIIEAETKLIEAEAEKKANELLNQSLSEDILQKQWIDKWDGEMPTYYGDSDNLMIGLN
jgi:regulator of protease activity HflC (stomatin/prohibitin superfamily)